MVLPSASIGGLIGVVVVVAVQPGTGLTLTKANGLSAGSWIFSDVVLAVSLSLGMRKVISPKPPGAASGELTDTCADAVPTPRVRTATTTANTVRAAPRSPVVVTGSPRGFAGQADAVPVTEIVVAEARLVPPPTRSPNRGRTHAPGEPRCSPHPSGSGLACGRHHGALRHGRDLRARHGAGGGGRDGRRSRSDRGR